MTGKWRARARPIIARVLQETRGLDEADIQAALREAYPFGERAYYPYDVWRDEIARQRAELQKAEAWGYHPLTMFSDEEPQ